MPPDNDIVLDVNVVRLYNNPADPKIRALFDWLFDRGTLTLSDRLYIKYVGIGNQLLITLIDYLIRSGRRNPIRNVDLDNFRQDNHFRYRCNAEDHHHARLVFLSKRKRLVSFDHNLVADVNRFPRVSGIKPTATDSPDPSFYE